MGLFVSVLDVHVGMNQAEVIKALLEQSIEFGKNDNAIFTTNYAYFCGERFSVRFELNSGVVSKIAMTWVLNNKGQINTRKEEAKIIDTYNKVVGFISKNGLSKYSENTEFGKGLRFKRGEYLNLYNRISISAQYKMAESGLNAVFVGVEDVNSGEIKPHVFEFLRSQAFIIEGKKQKTQKCRILNTPIKTNHIYKVILIIIIAVIGFLYVQNNRYYYAKNGKIRVDKWKNERAVLNSFGKYEKE